MGGERENTQIQGKKGPNLDWKKIWKKDYRGKGVLIQAHTALLKAQGLWFAQLLQSL